MSLYCIIGHDAQDSEKKRDEYRDVHLDYLRLLRQDSCLLAAGPLMDSESTGANACGSMLIVDFENQHAAANEPYNQTGVYKEVHIYPYLDAMPNI